MTVRTSVVIPTFLEELVANAADIENVTQATVIRRAIAQYFGVDTRYVQERKPKENKK